MQDLANVFFRFKPWNHDLMAAALTPESKISTGSQNKPTFLSAGMFFFHYQNIPQPHIHYPSRLPLTVSQ